MSQYLLEMAGNNSVGDQLIDLNTNFCVIPSLWMHRFFAKYHITVAQITF